MDLIPILKNLLEDELKQDNPSAHRLIQIISNPDKNIDDLMIVTEISDGLPSLKGILPQLIKDILDQIPLIEFSKDIDHILRDSLQSNNRKTLKKRKLLTDIKKFLGNPIIDNYKPQLSLDLVDLIITVKNINHKIRFKYLFDKIESMLIDSAESSDSESSEYV